MSLTPNPASRCDIPSLTTKYPTREDMAEVYSDISVVMRTPITELLYHYRTLNPPTALSQLDSGE